MKIMRKQTGAIALPILAVIVALLGGYVSIVALARYQGVHTRLHQAQQQAVLAVAKEGRGGDNRNDAALQALMQAYLRNNLEVLGKTGSIGSTALVAVDADREQMSLHYPLLPWFRNTGDMDSQLLSISSQVRAERFFRKTETTIVLGASAFGGRLFRQSSFVEEAKQGVKKYIRQMFRDQVQARDAWVSLVSYDQLVNIGWEYKDKLITPESRLIPPYLEAVAREFHWWEDQDLLSPRGVAGKRRAVCAYRQLYKEAGRTLQDIVDLTEFPPPTSSQGFHASLFHGTIGSTESAAQIAAIVNFYLAPFGISPEDYGLQKPSSDRNFARAIGAGLCAMMPMLVASTNGKQLEENVEMYEPITFSAPDQGLAWALRTLSPKWRSLWNRGPVPHDYGPNVDKKIVILLTAGMTGVPADEVSLLSLLCDRIRERGIEVIALFNGDIKAYWYSSGGTGSTTRRAIARCTPSRQEEIGVNPHMQFFSNKDHTLPQVFERLGRRTYRVRLVNY